MKVVILGSSGMLGNMVKSSLALPTTTLEVISFDRTTFEVSPKGINELGGRLSHLCGFDTDYVINCIGAIKPTFDKARNHTRPIYTNAVFPHQLALWCELTDTKLIHITTDCVFTGDKGRYVENDPHDCSDVYGQSKSLGEPNSVMNLRTSIIGPEVGGRKRSLLEWIKSQDGKSINGYTNHLWNGLTTLELARCIEDIMLDELWTPGIFHIFSSDVSKHTLIEEVAHQYALDIDITPTEADVAVDRTLRTLDGMNSILCPQDIDVQIGDLVDWEDAHKGR